MTPTGTWYCEPRAGGCGKSVPVGLGKCLCGEPRPPEYDQVDPASRLAGPSWQDEMVDELLVRNPKWHQPAPGALAKRYAAVRGAAKEIGAKGRPR